MCLIIDAQSWRLICSSCGSDLSALQSRHWYNSLSVPFTLALTRLCGIAKSSVCCSQELNSPFDNVRFLTTGVSDCETLLAARICHMGSNLCDTHFDVPYLEAHDRRGSIFEQDATRAVFTKGVVKGHRNWFRMLCSSSSNVMQT